MYISSLFVFSVAAILKFKMAATIKTDINRFIKFLILELAYFDTLHAILSPLDAFILSITFFNGGHFEIQDGRHNMERKKLAIRNLPT